MCGLIALTGEAEPDSGPSVQQRGRLRALSAYELLEAGPIARLDRITRLVSDVLRVPSVSITLIDDRRIWRKAGLGLPSTEPPLASSFARHCLDSGDLLTIEDSAADPRFAAHPFVSGEPFLRSYAGRPLRNPDGWTLGVIGVWDRAPRRFDPRELDILAEFGEVAVDAIELHKALLVSKAAQGELASREALFREVFENAAVGIALNKLDGTRMAVNDRLCELIGHEKRELLDMSLWENTHPDDIAEHRWLMRRLTSGELSSVQGEKRIIRGDGKHHWVQVHASLVRDGGGRPHHTVVAYLSIDERKQAEFARNMLLGEINHRVKNTLAIIQGMAKQMQRSVRTPEQFSAAFEERLQALSMSHDMLTQSNWKPLRLEDVIEAAFGGAAKPFRPRISVACPDVTLRSQAAVLLGLIFHELSTNAIKYGALLLPEGSVSVMGTLTDGPGRRFLEIVWEERGGTAVTAPSRTGFGHFMLNRGIRVGLSGEASTTFTPSGLVYRCRIPADQNLTPA